MKQSPVAIFTEEHAKFHVLRFVSEAVISTNVTKGNREFTRDFADNRSGEEFARLLNSLAQHNWKNAAYYLRRVKRLEEGKM